MAGVALGSYFHYFYFFVFFFWGGVEFKCHFPAISEPLFLGER